MISIKPPKSFVDVYGRKLFLAGSIESGTADQWQKSVEENLIDTDWVILNPRRDDWDEAWEQRKDNPKFLEQVEWELAGLEAADQILFYFDPQTKSPVTMVELGLCARSSKILVVCPEGFWRKGNVDIVCDKYQVPQFADLAAAINFLKQ